MDDRTHECAFCDAPSTGRCARCESVVCDEHRGSRPRWCTECQKERREALLVAVAMEELRGPGVIDPTMSWQGSLPSLSSSRRASRLNLWRIVSTWVTRPWRTRHARRQAEAELDTMTPEVIARERAARLSGRRGGLR